MESLPQKIYPGDLALALHENYRNSRSSVLLARAHSSGTLELLTAAWGKVLGYGEELKRKTLSQLMGSGEQAAAAVIAAILDEGNMEPVDLVLNGRDGRGRKFRLHRRYDHYAHKVYIVAEEIARSAARTGPERRTSARH